MGLRQVRVLALLAASLAAGIAGCGKQSEPAKKASGPPASLVSAIVVQARDLEIIENVVGSLENVIDPSLGAEVAGRVVRVLAFTGKKISKGELLAEIDPQDFEIQTRADSAEIARQESLLAQAERVAERQQKLVSQGFISQNAADDAVAQRNALRENIKSAKARGEQTHRSMAKTRITAPIDGEVEAQIVAPGDYVKVGDPLFKLVGTQRLHAHLALPETAHQVIRPGLAVRLSAPTSPDKVVQAKISEIRPTVGVQNRALNAIVKFDNDGSFRGGGSVTARIVLAVREKALTVPEQSVVLRPAGKVVYVLVEQEGRLVAQQRPVETGVRQDGYYEIVKGLKPGERVAVDGAGFLTNNALVMLPKPKPAAEKGAGKDAKKKD